MCLKQFTADLHIHSRFSRATSPKLDLLHLAGWAGIKGIHVLGTGDFTHPKWIREIDECLMFNEESGLYKLKDNTISVLPEWVINKDLKHNATQVRFMLQTGISSIYKRSGKVRKVHNLVYMPNLEVAERFNIRLAKIGNLSSDGRPIIGLDSEDLLDIVLNTHPEAYLVPAHIWTPWFSIFGSKSGFDTIKDCFGSLAPHVFAMETGLSSDPEMNRRLSMLDNIRFISNSDAHSGDNLAREANIFEGEISYLGIYNALKASPSSKSNLSTTFKGTFEFYPDEGKYFLDGHRACKIRLTPEETKELNNICPVCCRPLTLGVLYRVEELADRSEAQFLEGESFNSLIPLMEVVAEITGAGVKSKRTTNFYQTIVNKFGSELDILNHIELSSLKAFSAPLAEGIRRMRQKEVIRSGGYDGEYGTIHVFSNQEQNDILINSRKMKVESPSKDIKNFIKEKQSPKNKTEQANLFGEPKPANIKICVNQPKVVRTESKSDSHFQERLSDIPSTQLEAKDDMNKDAVPSLLETETDKQPKLPQGAQIGRPEEQHPERLLKNYAGLNEKQLCAVFAGPSPIFIKAGPGTGKTDTLISRVRRLLESGVSPSDILILTFSRRASIELDERLKSTIEPSLILANVNDEAKIKPQLSRTNRLNFSSGSNLPRSDTLHALALEFWCKFSGETPLILSEDAAIRVFNEANSGETYQKRNKAWEAINFCRERREPLPTNARDMYDLYAQHKESYNLADYTDLLEYWLAQHSNGLFIPHWEHVLVDEVQDLTPLQFSLIQALIPQGGEGFFGIGDPDQAIYGYRGAQPDTEEYLKKLWPGLNTIELDQVYRFGVEILNVAKAILQPNYTPNLNKTSHACSEVHYFEANSAESEATWIVGQIRQMLGMTSHKLQETASASQEEIREYTPRDFAILFRTKSIIQPIRRSLERAGIPFDQPSVNSFWHDPRVASMLELAGSLAGISMPLEDEYKSLRKKPLPDCPDKVVLRGPLSMSAYWGNSEPFDRLFWQSEAFKNLTDAFSRYDGWSGLLGWLGLQNELEEVRLRADKVQLLTIHASKGLEFPIVFLPALEEGLTPYSGLSFLTGRPNLLKIDVNEENRLLYVGISRAKEGLYLSRATKRFIAGHELRLKQSRFLDNLPDSGIKRSAIIEHKKSLEKQLKLI